jgi:transcriptional regulator with XRE-family HTH domain
MVRHMYATLEPTTQVDLAAQAGVSQPAVSQYLSSLRENGDVSFEDAGWSANRAQLPASYWNAYASRFASQSYWYRIDAVTTQVDDMVERRPELIVSGDAAADAVLPWKVPAIAIVYGSIDDLSMDEFGFVRADTAATATVLVRPVPDDSFVRDALDIRAMRVAAHLHLVADLIGLGGDDRLEAAERFARLGR